MNPQTIFILNSIFKLKDTFQKQNISQTFFWLQVLIWSSYILASLVFWERYSYYGTDDTLSYIQIADNYSKGYFKEAINACWSPLMCWLMVPFIKMGMNGFYTLKLINIFAGIVCIRTSLLFFQRLRPNNENYIPLIILQLTLIVIIIPYQTMIAMPDLLAAAMVLLFTYKLIQKDFALAGIFGALAYFAKAYNFFFALIVFLLFILFEFIINRKLSISFLRNTAVGVLIFFVLSGIWIVSLYKKYDTLTISSAGSYNTWVLQPDGKTIQFDQEKIIPPPHKHAASSWYDPTYYNVKPRKIFESEESFLFYLSILKVNLSRLNYCMSSLSYFKIFWFLLIPFGIIFFSVTNKEAHLFLFLLSIIYISGYTLILVDQRYVLFSYFIMTVLTFSIALHLKNKYLTTFILVLSAAAISKNGFINGKSFYFREKELKGNYEYAKKISALPEFKNYNFISDKPVKECYVIAYLSGSSYYGYIGSKKPEEALTEGVKMSELDYFISFDDRVLQNTAFVKDLKFYSKTAKLYRFLKSSP